MDMAAKELGLDPVEIRLKNAIEVKPGEVYQTVNKVTVRSCGIKEALKKIAEHPLWRDKDKRPKREGNIHWGVGISATTYLSGARQRGHQSCAALVRICEDGTVNLITGATDAGQGSDTVLSMIVAEELGIPLEMVDIKRVDSAYTPVDPGTYGSRVTVLAGQATQLAARDAKRQLLAALARYWEISPEDIEIRNGVAFCKTDATKVMPFKQLARLACYSGPGSVIIGRGHSTYGLEPLDFETGIGDGGTAYSFTAQAARVGVDVETGKIIVTDFVIAHDCGTPLNPTLVEAQNEGGAVQGLGQTLYEEFVMQEGRTLNPTFLDYKMPRSTDVPNIEVIHIPTYDPNGPYGAKEASEGSIVSTPPAIVNAIYDAIGVWIKDLPATPEKVMRALESQREKIKKNPKYKSQ